MQSRSMLCGRLRRDRGVRLPGLLQISPSAHSPLPLWVGGADTECENVKVSAGEAVGTVLRVCRLMCW